MVAIPFENNQFLGLLTKFIAKRQRIAQVRLFLNIYFYVIGLSTNQQKIYFVVLLSKILIHYMIESPFELIDSKSNFCKLKIFK